MTGYLESLQQALQEFLPLAKFKPGQIFVIGCSTSEILGKAIGKGTSREVGLELFRVLQEFCESNGIFPAFQCCEHLNRALVVNRNVQEKYGLTEVSVVPVPGAGGSLAAAAFQGLPEAVVVETVQAHAGIDIGDTFIGMHLRPVVVPVRISLSEIGQAHLTLARTRPRLIGGQRAIYQQGTCN
ncbi:MAG TPA: TIGR01440 family protein [Desulfobacteria bacterium]|nr:TIGR01440 family protein [Desulfobacteria bacterium]